MSVEFIMFMSQTRLLALHSDTQKPFLTHNQSYSCQTVKVPLLYQTLTHQCGNSRVSESSHPCPFPMKNKKYKICCQTSAFLV